MSRQSSLITVELLNKISKDLELGTTEDGINEHSIFWSINVQTYENINIAVLCSNKSLYEMTENNDSCSLSEQNINNILNLNNVFYDIDSNEIIMKTVSNHKTVISNSIDLKEYIHEKNVSFHPFIEGVVVYRWMYKSKPMFSTQKRINARFTRYGNSRFITECMNSLGGPTNKELFPTDSVDENGNGVVYSFLLSHKSFTMTSHVDLGDGRIFFLGAMDSKSGNFISDDDDRIKWQGISEIVNNYHYNDNDNIANDEVVVEVSAEEFCADNDEMAKDAAEFAAEVKFTKYEMEKFENENETINNKLYPFPPPSKGYEFGSIGNSIETVERCLEERNDINNDVNNKIYKIPTFDNAYQMMDYLKIGPYMYNDDSDIDVNMLKSVSDSIFGYGEPVIVKIKESDGQVNFIKYQPISNAWKTFIKNGDFNVSHRISKIYTLAQSCSESVMKDNVSFDISNIANIILKQHNNDVSESYPLLFPQPPPFIFSDTFNGKKFLTDLLNKNKTNALNLIDLANQNNSPSNINNETVVDKLYWWGCICMISSVSPHMRHISITSSIKLYHMIKAIINFMRSLINNRNIFNRVLRVKNKPYVEYSFAHWKTEKTNKFIPAASYATDLLFGIIYDISSTSKVNNNYIVSNIIKSHVKNLSGEKIYSIFKAMDSYNRNSTKD
jgi:hypothetical protein